MLKKYLCGAALLAVLCAPVSAEELYVRNHAFGDAFFVAGTTYVPVASFLKALDVDWTDNGATVVLGSGDSPEEAFDSETITVVQGDKSLDLSGMLRGGKLYVPAKELAKFVGYTVINSPETGVIDVLKTREITSTDQAAAKEVAATAAAAEAARKSEREARQAKEKAYAEAKAAAEAKANGETGDEEVAEDAASGTESAKDDKASESAAASSSASATAETSAAAKTDAAPAAESKPKEPPKANMVVLSSGADPNYYTGEVVFRAVLQNQGFAPAENLTAQMSVVGPDGRNWLTKTYYHPAMAADDKWEIVENYKHRLGSAMPRGSFTVNVAPKFTSGTVPETK
jgi:hypothetical protein